MSNILERLQETPLVWDGAMGTMTYARGVFINTCYDELCLTRPELIKEIHGEYVTAGADVVETNTFGANAVKLREYGLIDHVEAINRSATELARSVVGESGGYVAGSVGPCLTTAQLLNESNRDDVLAAVEQQVGVLADAGVDLIQLETFVHKNELELAASVARKSGLPVLASFSTRPGAETTLGGSAMAVKAMSGVHQHIDVRPYEPEAVEVTVTTTTEKSRFARRICTGEKVTSIELLPPKSCDISKLIARSSLCREHGVDAINIPDGPRASARVSPMVAATAIMNEAGIEEGIAIGRGIIECIAPRVAGFQVSAPFGRVEIALKVLGRI